MSFEGFNDFIVMNGPVQDEVIFFGGYKNGIFMMGVWELFDLMIFEE